MASISTAGGRGVYKWIQPEHSADQGEHWWPLHVKDPSPPGRSQLPKPQFNLWVGMGGRSEEGDKINTVKF